MGSVKKKNAKPGPGRDNPRDSAGRIMADPKVVAAYRKSLRAYIDSKAIPIMAEWCYLNHVRRDQVHTMEYLKDLADELLAKKEASLEQGALFNKVNVAMAIFSMKQRGIGWSDNPQLEKAEGKKQKIKIGGKEIEF